MPLCPRPCILGMKPFFVDAHPASSNIDPGKIRGTITLKTKAVIVTNMWGVPCAMEIVESCKMGIVLLEGNLKRMGFSVPS